MSSFLIIPHTYSAYVLLLARSCAVVRVGLFDSLVCIGDGEVDGLRLSLLTVLIMKIDGLHSNLIKIALASGLKDLPESECR